MHWLHLISKLSDLFLQIYNTLILNQTRHSQVWFSWLPVLEGCIQKYNPPKQYWQAGPIILYEWCYNLYLILSIAKLRSILLGGREGKITLSALIRQSDPRLLKQSTDSNLLWAWCCVPPAPWPHQIRAGAGQELRRWAGGRGLIADSGADSSPV